MKLCPFCGSDDVGYSYRMHPDGRELSFIACGNCGASGPVRTYFCIDDDDESAAAWDKRYNKAEHAKVAEMIALFEAQSSETTEIHFPEFLVELKHGEEYAGLIVGKDGEASYHLVLIPGQADSINWPDAKAWSVKQGGELPTLREQSLLFANLNEQFEEAYYWSGEQHASCSDYAWFQNFGNGDQDTLSTYGKLRARAVRRLII